MKDYRSKPATKEAAKDLLLASKEVYKDVREDYILMYLFFDIVKNPQSLYRYKEVRRWVKTKDEKRKARKEARDRVDPLTLTGVQKHFALVETFVTGKYPVSVETLYCDGEAYDCRDCYIRECSHRELVYHAKTRVRSIREPLRKYTY